MFDFTLIIPTNNRHNYLKRSIAYYDALDAVVIYCDSSIEKYDCLLADHITYLHLPQKSFSEKILIALDRVKTKYVALCADDDFIIIESLYEGVDFLSHNNKFKTIVGKYIAFHEEYDDNLYILNNVIPKDLAYDSKTNVELFFKKYYQILWAMYDKEILTLAFKVIKKANFKHDNFIELVLGAMICFQGGIKFLDSIWGARELTLKEHWGSQEKEISEIVKEENEDEVNFKFFLDQVTYEGYSSLVLENYLLFSNRLKANTKQIPALASCENHEIKRYPDLKKVVINSVVNSKLIYLQSILKSNTLKDKGYMHETKKRLIIIQGTNNLLNVISSLFYEEDKNNGIEYEDYLLLFGMCINHDKNSDIIDASLDLAKVWKWKKIIDLTKEENDLITLYNLDRKKGVDLLRKLIKIDSFDQVYSVRNWQDSNELVLNAYKESYHICYGDVLGSIDFVFSNGFVQYHEIRQLLTIFNNDYFTKLKELKRTIKSVVIEKKYLLTVIDKYIELMDNNKIINNDPIKQNSILLLTTTLYESNFTSKDNYYMLYLELLSKNYNNEEIIYLKPHPRELLEKIEELSKKIMLRFKIKVVILNRNFTKSVPIEILFKMFKFTKIVSFFTECVINLKYLYGVKGGLYINKEFLSYINENKRKYVWQNSIEDEHLLSLIDTWDGKSVLEENYVNYPGQPHNIKNLKGEEFLKRGNYKEALGLFLKSIRLNRDFPEPYNNIGLTYLYLHKIDIALNYFLKAYHCDKTDKNVILNLSDVYLMKNNYKAATTLLFDFLDKEIDKDILNELLKIYVNSDLNILSFFKKNNRDGNNVIDYLINLDIYPLYADSETGQVIKKIMLSPIGKYIRKLIPKYNPSCNEFPNENIVILSDGSISTCCKDGYGENSFASIYDKDLNQVFDEDVKGIINNSLYSLKKCRGCIGSNKAPLISQANEIEKKYDFNRFHIDSITVEIMGACNYGCCISPKIKNYRAVKPDLFKIFDNIKEFVANEQVKRIRLFNYGEPLLHEDFIPFVNKIRSVNKKVILSLATNAMLMDEKVSLGLIENKLQHLIISVHGGPGTENMLKYSKFGADYDKIINNIKRLVALKKERKSTYPYISLRAILFNWNDKDEDLNKFRADAKQLGLAATWGNPDTNNYHWIHDQDGRGARASQIYHPHSREKLELIASKEFFVSENWNL